jgi:hypothetical protein
MEATVTSETEEERNLAELDDECAKTKVELEPAAHQPKAHQGADRTGKPLHSTYCNDI